MEITREEFYRAIDTLKTDLLADIGEVKAHLRILNGRTGKGEQADAAMLVRVRGLEKELYNHPRRRKDDDGQGAAWAAGTVTKREGALIGFGLVIITVLIKVLELVGTKLWTVLMSPKP